MNSARSRIFSGSGKRVPFSQRLQVASDTPNSTATFFRAKPFDLRHSRKRLANSSRAEVAGGREDVRIAVIVGHMIGKGTIIQSLYDRE